MNKAEKTTRIANSLVAAACLAGGLVAANHASAAPVNPPAGAPTSHVYVTEILGNQYVAFTANGTNCQFVQVGNGFGLWDNVALTLDNLGSYAEIVEQPYTHLCGFTFKPVKLNGWFVDIFAQGGNDTVYSSSYSPTSSVFGGAGGDIIFGRNQVATTHQQLYGGPDGDRLVARGAWIHMNGDDGNDALCITTSTHTARKADGGSGWDTRCGNAPVYMDGIEAYDCSATSFCAGY